MCDILLGVIVFSSVILLLVIILGLVIWIQREFAGVEEDA